MLRYLDSLLRGLRMRWFDQRIQQALNLHLRGEVRSDGLRLKSVSSTLELEWWARDIHPWDRNLPSQEDPEVRFVKQAVTDTEAVLTRLFAAMPRIETIALRVFDPANQRTILSGEVQRADFALPRPRSARMWLSQLGISFYTIEKRLEAVETNCT